jgi:hypothetical protein
MQDHRNTFACRFTIFRGKQIALHHVDSHTRGRAPSHRIEVGQIARWPHETDEIAKPVIEQTPHNPTAYKAGGTSYQDAIIGAGYEAVVSAQLL